MAFNVPILKRQKFVISSLALSGLLAAALIWSFHGLAIGMLLVATYGVVVWCLDGDLKKDEWVILPLYPLWLSGIVGLVLIWYIQQQSWLQWLGIVIYGIAIYGLLLTINILNVATVRGLPLIRQAISVMSLAGIVGLFSSYYLLLTLLPTTLEWVSGVVAISFMISWPLVWASKLGHSSATANIQTDLGWSALIALLAAQLAAIVAFWPVSFMTSLFVAGSVAMIVGIIHYQQLRQVSKVVQLQYLVIGAVMVVVYFILSQWT